LLTQLSNMRFLILIVPLMLLANCKKKLHNEFTIQSAGEEIKVTLTGNGKINFLRCYDTRFLKCLKAISIMTALKTSL